jgi:hypothetical protein
VSAEKSEIRKEQHERERQWKNTGKETRDNLKDVNQRSAESEISQGAERSRKTVEEH